MMCHKHNKDKNKKLFIGRFEPDGNMTAHMQLLWDIPTNIFVPSLFSKVMLVHHIGMAVGAYICVVSEFAHFYLPLAC